MIALTCPKCRVSLQLKVELGGKKIKCPKCQAVLQVPTPAAAAAAAARPKSLAPAPPVDDLSPYGIEPIQEVPEEAKDNRIDDLVIVANRQKARNRAWNIVGPPAKWIKVVALIACFLWVVMFLYMTMATILYLHKYEQFIRKVDGGPKSMNEIRWMWPVNEFVERDAAPGYVFGITCAVFFPVMTIYGFILAGAESMKRLERYRLAVFGAWLTFLMMPPLAAMAILALNKKEVKYEFEVSRLRAAGVEDPYAELEALEAERQGGDDDEDDDEDEDD